jgi:large subunit ribosomal protein L21
MFAVIATGGKQYLAKVGDTLTVEKIEGAKGDAVTFDKVLLIAEDDASKVDVGTPYLKATVTGELMSQGRAEKIEVVHYKAKVRYKKRSGHRQPFTKVKITKIG